MAHADASVGYCIGSIYMFVFLKFDAWIPQAEARRSLCLHHSDRNHSSDNEPTDYFERSVRAHRGIRAARPSNTDDDFQDIRVHCKWKFGTSYVNCRSLSCAYFSDDVASAEICG